MAHARRALGREPVWPELIVRLERERTGPLG